MVIIKQNEDYTEYLHMYYPDTGAPVEFDPASEIYCEMRSTPDGELAAAGTCSADASNGDIWINFSSEQTAALEAGKYGFDVWIVVDGKKHCLFEQDVRIVESYTKNFGGGE